MRRRNPDVSVGPLDLLEQAIHLLRTAPVAALLAYYVGAAPFVLGLLFFWSDMSRSPFAESRLVGGAVGLAISFVWMKSWQTVFATLLRAHVAQQPAPAWTVRRVVGMVARQMAIQPSGLFLLPIALLVLLPFGWLFAFYQNACVLGAVDDDGDGSFLRRTWRETMRDAMQNHTVIAVAVLFAIFVWLNLAIAVLSAPFLFRMFTGVETAFTLNIESALNTTVFAVICGLTYLCVDPVIKAAYVLRCFYGESRGSGEDLRVRLRVLAEAATLLLAAMLLMQTPDARAAEPGSQAPVPTSTATDLDRSIEQVLARREYAWRAPREKASSDEQKTGFWKRVDEWLRNVAKSIRDLWNKWMNRRVTTPGGFSLFSGAGLTYTLIVIVAATIGIVLYVLWRAADRARKAQLEAAPVPPVPDVADENVGAEQLPEDGWLRLALELMERGELRLALRALYLASLAHLAERNLITLAKSKSNREYERELLKRSHALPEVSRVFSENVSVFDRVWYGLHEINTDLLQQFRLNVERIKAA